MGIARRRHDAGQFSSHVRKGDQVVVLAGRSNGDEGRVVHVDPQRERAIVEGLNLVTKHVKANPQGGRAAQQQSGRIQMPAPIHLSNLMVLCPSCNKATRVAHGLVGDKNVRLCKKCGQALDRTE
ncbi:MAG: 50S ribosomal protein L24 [Armatimonadetes bacterium]|nr:50S ribosomal protein L24 [Armatimonadota bacterium]